MDSPTLVERLSPADYVTIKVHAATTGYSERAIERKIQDGVWLENDVWVKAPDGRRLISKKGYNRWVERGQG
jgi:hypothetical protein